jgi:tetraacyldisaccharide 4'-kinase
VSAGGWAGFYRGQPPGGKSIPLHVEPLTIKGLTPPARLLPISLRGWGQSCYISGVSLPAHYRDIISGSRRGLVAPCARLMLAAVEPVYGWVVRRKNRRFDSSHAAAVRVAAPVISVGNLTVGGTGKTPLVCWLAKWLRERGQQVTLISRGYGSRSGPNDEALELAAQLPDMPHLQNADRVAAAQEALRQNPRQVLLLDDAFQHRRLARDLDIVLLDALEPFGYGHLLPRGLLREPIENLNRAHVIGLSRADAVSLIGREQIRQQVQKLAPAALWIELAHQPRGLIDSAGRRIELSELHGQRVAAFCGIGNPAGFRHTLSQCGVEVAAMREFPDHCSYTPGVLQELEAWISKISALKRITTVLCTRKDLVKIPREKLAGMPLLAVDVELEIMREREEFQRRLTEALA